MISAEEAKKIILENTQALLPKKILLGKAAGLVLAEDIFALTAVPGFAQSSMDGYALAFRDWQSDKRLKITGVIAAGDSSDNVLLSGSAVRIFTGAAVPAGADTVVMQEKTKIENNELIIEDNKLEQGINIRAVGAEIKKGELALPKNILLTPAAIGFLVSAGINEVFVYPNPSVTIIVTGNELQEPGTQLQHGQLYEANSFTLKAALKHLHIDEVKIMHCEDHLQKLTETLGIALQQSDLVFLTGGISVGDFDFVLQATINNGVQKLFHRIKQKPAKPLYFGKKEHKYVFGLPGNPASGLTAFYEYASPAIGFMCKRNYHLQTMTVHLKKYIKKPAGLTYFLKGFYDGQTVNVLDGQESYKLSSFAKANCLIQIGEEVTECKENELVEIHLLPV